MDNEAKSTRVLLREVTGFDECFVKLEGLRHCGYRLSAGPKSRASVPKSLEYLLPKIFGKLREEDSLWSQMSALGFYTRCQHWVFTPDVSTGLLHQMSAVSFYTRCQQWAFTPDYVLLLLIHRLCSLIKGGSSSPENFFKILYKTSVWSIGRTS